MYNYSNIMAYVIDANSVLYKNYADIIKGKVYLNIANESNLYYSLANENITEKIKNFAKSVYKFLKDLCAKIKTWFIKLFNNIKNFLNRIFKKKNQSNKNNSNSDTDKSNNITKFFIEFDTNNITQFWIHNYGFQAINIQVDSQYMQDMDNEQLKHMVEVQKSVYENVGYQKGLDNACDRIINGAKISNDISKQEQCMKAGLQNIETLEKECNKITKNCEDTLNKVNGFSDAEALNLFKEYWSLILQLETKIIAKVVSVLKKFYVAEANTYSSEDEAKAALNNIREDFKYSKN